MKHLLSRRDFHRGVASAALASALPSINSRPEAPPPVRLAVIGPGKRGMNLMRGAFLRDGFEVVAVCDVDPNRLAAAKKLADNRQPNTLTFSGGYNDFCDGLTNRLSFRSLPPPDAMRKPSWVQRFWYWIASS